MNKTGVWVLLILLLITPAIAQTINVDENLITYLRFEENNYNGTTGEIKDDSQYNITGTAINGTNSTPNGKIGRGIILDGTNDYTIQENHTLYNDFSEQITIAMWVKPTGTYTSWMTPIGKGNTGYGEWSLAVNIDDGWVMGTITNSGETTRYQAIYTKNYEIGEWVFIATTYDGTYATTYVSNSTTNQLYYSTSPFSGNIKNNSSTTVKLGIIGLTDKYYEGSIDEVMIFNKSLTKEELEYIYNEGNGTILSSCTEDWQAQYTDQTACRTNNTILQLITYNDQNACGTNDTLPGDNGTIEENYCNYCDPDWSDIGSECYLNETRYVEYIDLNTCYSITNLTEDAPPGDHQTWQNCTYFTKQFNCTINPIPYTNKRVDYQCEMPSIQTWYCVNKIKILENDEVIQTNPQKTEKTSSFLLSKTTESRTKFESDIGIVNLYYTNKNVKPDEQLVLTTTCTNLNQTLKNEQLLVPEIKTASYYTQPRMIWLKNNAFQLVAALLILVLLFWVLIGIWRSR